jgi:hypothetical protein
MPTFMGPMPDLTLEREFKYWLPMPAIYNPLNLSTNITIKKANPNITAYILWDTY